MKTTQPSGAAAKSLLPLPGWVPEPGDVIHYSYLWRDEFKAGKEDGAKDRPCVVLVSELRGNTTRVIVAPITSQDFAGSTSIKVPQPYIDAMNLKPGSLIIASDLNAFDWISPDVRPRENASTHYGHISAKLTDSVLAAAQQLRVPLTGRTI